MALAGFNCSMQMDEITTTIMTAATSGLFTIECLITSPDNAELNVSLAYIRQFSIEQMPPKAYADMVELQVELTLQEYYDLIKHYQNLRCLLIFKFVEKETFAVIPDKPPLTYSGRVMFKNTPDLAKELPIGVLRPDMNNPETEAHHGQRITVDLQLMDPDLYELRKVQINGILTNATVKQGLFYVMSLLGIKKTAIVPPDNETVYNNFSIPPMLNLSNVIDYVQNQYGVYNKGCEYYFADGRLYVYPAYETEPKSSKNTVHIYNVPPGRFAGASGFHTYLGEDLHIVCNTAVMNQSHTERAIETIGNSIAFLDASKVIDNFRNLLGNKMSVGEKNVAGFDLQTSKGVKANTQHTQYARVSSNPFLFTSKMAEQHGETVVCGWIHALPMAFSPGQRVVFHYDDDGVYTHQKGICQGIVYTIKEVQRPSYPVYACVGQMFLFLDAEKKR